MFIWKSCLMYKERNYTSIIEGVRIASMVDLQKALGEDFIQNITEGIFKDIKFNKTTSKLLNPDKIMHNLVNWKVDCPYLQSLELSKTPNVNNDGSMAVLLNSDIFHAPMLQVLNISGLGLTKIPSAVQQIIGCVSLIHVSSMPITIDMSRNNISMFTFRFPDDYKLYYRAWPEYNLSINLTQCNISILKLDNVITMKENPYVHINIADNPIACECGLRPALEYMYKYDTYFSTSYYKYLWQLECAAPPNYVGTILKDVDIAKMCSLSKITLITLLSAVCGSIVLVIVVGICCYGYRHTVKAVGHNMMWMRLRRFRNQQGRHHVFLACSDDDSQIAEAILEHLEAQVAPISVFYAKRDILPGTSWLTGVCAAMTQSDFTIIMITQNFLDSEYCMFDFRLAYDKSVQQRSQSLIAVLTGPREELGDVTDASLSVFLQMTNFLVYGERWFWDKLIHVIRQRPQAMPFGQQNLYENVDSDSDEHEEAV